MLLLSSVVVLMVQSASVTLTGTVRDAESGQPIARACIDLVPGPAAPCTGADGVYEVRIDTGRHVVRVHAFGYETQVLELVADRDGTIRLDIGLSVRPQPLSIVTIRGRRAQELLADDAGLRALDEAGATSATRAELRSRAALAGSDVLAAAALASGLAASPESPTALHVRGGSGDQNLLMLDGIPLYNATHFGGLLSAVNPDIVSSVIVHSGAPSARFGDAISSVTELRTDADGLRGTAFRGALDAISARQSVIGLLPANAGSYVVAGRVSSRHLLGPPEDHSNTLTAVTDLFGRLTLAIGHSTLELLAFNAHDRLAFSGRREAEPGQGGVPDPAPIADSVRNQFGWSTGTFAVSWHGELSNTTAFRLRLWRTAFTARATWFGDTLPSRLATSLLESAVALDVSRDAGAHHLEAGTNLQDRRTQYRVSQASTTLGEPPRVFIADERAPLMALFVEDRIALAPRWTATAGVRGDVVASPIAVDPRLSIRYSPSPGVDLVAGYARLRQYSQSLRNEHSLIDGLLGVALPVSSDAPGVPVARSEQVSLDARIALSARSRLRIDAYARRLTGVVLASVDATAPFASAPVQNGTGRALGASFWLERVGERTTVLAGYAFTQTDRRAAGLRYVPSFAAKHAIATSVAYRPRPATEVSLAMTALAGRRTRLSVGEIDWPASGLLSGFNDLGGSPSVVTTSDGVSGLSPYVRLDLGVRHDWALRSTAGERRLTLIGRVENVLSRRNVLGIAVSADGTVRRQLVVSPRVLRLGLEWVF